MENKSFTLSDLEKTVREAAPLFLDEARLRVEIKGKNDFVTEVDKNVQHFVKEKLHALAPWVLFMGEEEGEGEYFDGKYRVLGMTLPETILEKIYYKNAMKFIGENADI